MQVAHLIVYIFSVFVHLKTIIEVHLKVPAFVVVMESGVRFCKKKQ